MKRTEISCKDLKWTELAQDRILFQISVLTFMKVVILQQFGVTDKFCRRFLYQQTISYLAGGLINLVVGQFVSKFVSQLCIFLKTH
jgi:hypothetical protein